MNVRAALGGEGIMQAVWPVPPADFLGPSWRDWGLGGLGTGVQGQQTADGGGGAHRVATANRAALLLSCSPVLLLTSSRKARLLSRSVHPGRRPRVLPANGGTPQRVGPGLQVSPERSSFHSILPSPQRANGSPAPTANRNPQRQRGPSSPAYLLTCSPARAAPGVVAAGRGSELRAKRNAIGAS